MATGRMVARGGIEPPTRGFSVREATGHEAIYNAGRLYITPLLKAGGRRRYSTLLRPSESPPDPQALQYRSNAAADPPPTLGAFSDQEDVIRTEAVSIGRETIGQAP